MAPQTTNFNNQQFSGHQVQVFPATGSVFTNALLTINRAVNSGLNSLAITDSLSYFISFSLDDGATWKDIGGDSLAGGITSSKGVQHDTDLISVGYDGSFPIGTLFQLTTDATAQVRISGSMVLS